MKTIVTIDIAKTLNIDLISRSTVDVLYSDIEKIRESVVIIDFANVKFVTRSFMDEFYNKIINNNALTTKIELKNVSQDIQMTLCRVSKTQEKTHKVSQMQSSVKTFSNIVDVEKYFNILAL